MALGFLGRAPLQNPLGVVCKSNASIFNQFRTLCAQWTTCNPFTINRFRTLFSCNGGRGYLGLGSLLSAFAFFLQFCRFVFNQLQDAPPATLFFSHFCIVAGRWVGVGTAQVKVLLELEQRRPAAP